MSGPISTKASKDKTPEHNRLHSDKLEHQRATSGPQADILALQNAAGNQAVSQLLESTDGDRPSSHGNDLTDNASEKPLKPLPSATASVTDAKGLPFGVSSFLGKSRGMPLEPNIRAFMETRFGYDFRPVRVHCSAQGAESAQSLNAAAYTLGRDIVFGEGRYAPSMTEGMVLLAHELAHTIQQKSTFGDVATFAPGSASENNADTAAKNAVRGNPLGQVGSTAFGIARQSLGLEDVLWRITNEANMIQIEAFTAQGAGWLIQDDVLLQSIKWAIAQLKSRDLKGETKIRYENILEQIYLEALKRSFMRKVSPGFNDKLSDLLGRIAEIIGYDRVFELQNEANKVSKEYWEEKRKLEKRPGFGEIFFGYPAGTAVDKATNAAIGVGSGALCFFKGWGGAGLSGIAESLLLNPNFPNQFMLGMAEGIYDDMAESVRQLLDLSISDLLEMLDFFELIFEPEFKELACALGGDIGEHFATQLKHISEGDPDRIGREFGKLVGPAIFYTVISVVAPQLTAVNLGRRFITLTRLKKVLPNLRIAKKFRGKINVNEKTLVDEIENLGKNVAEEATQGNKVAPDLPEKRAPVQDAEVADPISEHEVVPGSSSRQLDPAPAAPGSAVAHGTVLHGRVSIGKKQRRELIEFWRRKIRSDPAKRRKYEGFIERIRKRKRPDPKQSEAEMEFFFSQIGGKSERAFKHGRKAKRGGPKSKGTTKPDVVHNVLIEVKNYKFKNRSALKRKLIEQTGDRFEHGPVDIKNQAIILDVRGQRVGLGDLQRLREDLSSVTGVRIENIEVVTW